jgi:hypothetical protein
MKTLTLITICFLFCINSFSTNIGRLNNSKYRYVTYQCGKKQLGYCFHLFTVSNDGANWEKVYLADSGCQLDKTTAIDMVQRGYSTSGWNGYECN